MSFPVTTRGPQTAADWTAANPILDQFEVGIEINPATGAYERAKLGDGRTAWADLAYWNPSGGPKVYRALLTQTGTDAPVATVLENTLGAVVWTYQGVGIYRGLLTNAFPESATAIFSGDRAGMSNSVASTQLFRRNDSELQLEVGAYTTVYNDPNWELVWTGGDDLLLAFPVMVYVNP